MSLKSLVGHCDRVEDTIDAIVFDGQGSSADNKSESIVR